MAGKIDRMWVNKEIALFNRSAGPDDDRAAAQGRIGNLADRILAHLRIPKDRKEELTRFLEMSTSEVGTIETTAIEIWDNFFGAQPTPSTTPAQAVESLLSEEEGRKTLKLSGNMRTIPINRETGEAEVDDEAQEFDAASKAYADHLAKMRESAVPGDWGVALELGQTYADKADEFGQPGTANAVRSILKTFAKFHKDELQGINQQHNAHRRPVVLGK